MKKLKLIISAVLLFLTQLTFAQGILGLINRSNEFFEYLDKGDFETAHSFFDESVKDKILPAELKLFWTRTDLALGAFQSVEGAQNKAMGDFYVVILNCKFAKGSQSFQFTYNKQDKLVGFFIVPNSTAAEYAKPAYADSTLYKETPIMIKSPGHELAGMLVTPRNGKNFPVVVLVHGSGPSDMDESVGPNKPFKDLAFGLAAKGIATVRYVKRTTVYPYEFQKAFTTREEVTEDAAAAIAYARSIAGADAKKIFLLGHSLGGMMAPRISTLAPDLAGIILASAPATKFPDVLAEQNKAAFEALNDTTQASRAQLNKVLAEIERTRISKLGNMKPDSLILGLPASYWLDLNQYDQVATARRIKNRVLVLQGGFDFQVTPRHFDLWKSALSTKKNASFKIYPKLNHLLIEVSEKGTVAQYRTPGNVAAYLIGDLAEWINKGV